MKSLIGLAEKRRLLFHSLTGLCYSFFGSLGLPCICTVIFQSPQRYPYLYPFSLWAGLLCAVVCIGLLVLNILLISRKPLPPSWLVQIPIVLLTFIPMLFGWVILVRSFGGLF